jgi:DnaJ-class molecular chaperone
MHKSVRFLQTTSDSIGKSLSEYTYCLRCAGNGFVIKQTDNKLDRKVCPLCNGSGKYFKDFTKERNDQKLSLTKDEKAVMESLIFNVDQLIVEAKKEQEEKRVLCRRCQGKGIIETDDSTQHGPDCQDCHGIGKDYSLMGEELMERCVNDMMDSGYSENEARQKCGQFLVRSNRLNEKRGRS